ncbi:unnamed protein product [Cyclocybe aegerita]|uniref:Uncharacterized protein n=1 Tax=Cyclocybe aegerita TaxID=1973307 RepID=A0A8S0X989_CYCAE|nr:unnamed protein product [Cyclocybe aegerita]
MATYVVEALDEPRIYSHSTPSTHMNSTSQARVLSLDIPMTTTPVHSQPPSSIADSAPPSPSPLLTGSDTFIPSSGTNSEIHSRSSSSATASTSSLPVPIRSESLGSSGSGNPNGSNSALNVRFAPLPELAPRKRRSAAPLGMAARGQLMRRRRGAYADNPNGANQDGPGVNADGSPVMSPAYAVSNPLWTDEEIEQQRRRLEALAARHAQYSASAAALDARHEEEEEMMRERERQEKARARQERQRERERVKATSKAGPEGGEQRGRGRGHRKEGSQELDPKFGTLSRLMKGASKSLWRRASNKDLAIDEAEKRSRLLSGDEKRRQSSTDPANRSASPIAPPTPKPQVPLRPILATIPSNGQAQRGSPPPEGQEDSDLDRRRSNGTDGTEDSSDGHDDHSQGHDEEGGVWEEEIGHMFKNIGQTETIVEGNGRVYTKVEISAAANGNARDESPSVPGTPTSELGGAEGDRGDRGDRGAKSLVKSLTSRTASPSLPIVNGKATKS